MQHFNFQALPVHIRHDLYASWSNGPIQEIKVPQPKPAKKREKK